MLTICEPKEGTGLQHAEQESPGQVMPSGLFERETGCITEGTQHKTVPDKNSSLGTLNFIP